MSSNNIKEEKETPSAFPDAFNNYGIAMHFVSTPLKDDSGSGTLESDNYFRSFERDILSHAFRDDSDFGSRVLEVPDQYKLVTLHMPEKLTYVAEGTERNLFQSPDSLDDPRTKRTEKAVRTRRLAMRASLTKFKSGICVLHIVFNPDRPPKETRNSDDSETVPPNLTEVDTEEDSRSDDSATTPPNPSDAPTEETCRSDDLVTTPPKPFDAPKVESCKDDESEKTPPNPQVEKWSLNEYDFIKFTKLWEGGESVGQSEPHDIHKEMKFSLSGDSEHLPLPLFEIVRNVIAEIKGNRTANEPKVIEWIEKMDIDNLRLRAGTIEISVGSGNHSDIFNVLIGLDSEKKDEVKVALGLIQGPLAGKMTAVQGILCGLLDYNIDAVEFADVFSEPIEANEDQLLDIHKGTLFQFITEDRSFESALPKIGISPYLLLPQSILLHNEALLRIAEKEAKEADGEQPEKRLRKAELALREVLQRKLLANVFQYETEIDLFEDGHKSRGLTNLQNSLKLRLEEINGRLDELKSEKAAIVERGLAYFGTGLAAFQAMLAWDPLAKLLRGIFRSVPPETGIDVFDGVAFCLLVAIVSGAVVWMNRLIQEARELRK